MQHYQKIIIRELYTKFYSKVHKELTSLLEIFLPEFAGYVIVVVGRPRLASTGHPFPRSEVNRSTGTWRNLGEVPKRVFGETRDVVEGRGDRESAQRDRHG